MKFRLCSMAQSRLPVVCSLLLRCFLVGAASAASQAIAAEATTAFVQPDFAQVDALIEQQLEREAIPGMAIAYVVDGQLTHERGFGLEMNARMPSAIGSVSKSFTAVAVMQLVEEGRVELEQPVSAYLSEFGSAVDSRAGSVTLRQLLSHRSGYSTYDGNFGQADYSEANISPSGVSDALEQKVRRLLGATLNANPGKQFEYSNANYQILGLVIERMDRESYEVALQRRVLDRVGMASSFVRVADTDDPEPAMAHRFWGVSPQPFNNPMPPGIVAQGGVYASAHDLALYLLDLMSPQPKLLSSAGRDKLFEIYDSSKPTGYGLGWNVEQRQGHRVIYHGGSNPGFESIAGFVPEYQFGFVALANAGTGFVGGNVVGTLGRLQALVFGPDKPLQDLPASNKVIAGVLCLLLVWLIYAVGCALRFGPSRWQWGFSLLSVGIATVFLYVLPKAFGIPLPGVIAFAPDIGWLLAGVGATAVINAFLRLIELGGRLLVGSGY